MQRYMYRIVMYYILVCGSPFVLCAQNNCNLLCNSDFEDAQVVSPGNFTLKHQSLIPCWETSATDGMIEIWGTGFNGVPAYSGNQFIELNANMVSTLSQDFTAVPGSTVTIYFAHRGRSGTDVMSVSLGPVGGPYISLGTFSAGNTAWIYNNVSYTFPVNGMTQYSLRFNSVSSAGGNPSVGNFLDAISVVLPQPSVSLQVTDVSCSGASDGSIVATPTGGTPPYQYSWQPVQNPVNSLSHIPAGSYTVTITDSYGCNTVATAVVNTVYPAHSRDIFEDICEGDNYLFNGVTHHTTGIYTVNYQNIYGCDSTVNLHLTVHPKYDRIENVTICANESYIFNGQPYNTPGTYYAQLQSVNGCDSNVTLHLSALPVLATTEIIETCEGQPVYFGEAYLNTSGTYSHTYQSSFGCDSLVILQLTVHPAPIAAFSFTTDMFVAFQPVLTITNHTQGASSYVWDFGDQSFSTDPAPVHTYNAEQLEYLITLVAYSPEGCADSTTQAVFFEELFTWYVPNSFTPNGDLHNPVFQPVFFSGATLREFRMTIFNRWGEVIFETGHPAFGWDGTHKNVMAPIGTYAWKIDFTLSQKSIPKSYRGHVNLLR